MSRHGRSDNLALLHSAFGEAVIDSILPGDAFTVDGVEFVCKYTTGSTAERFYVVKSLALIERYRQLCAAFTGATIVELGIAEGGSTALVALLARPERLIAVDLEPEPLAALTEFIAGRDLAEVVRPHYGVDQSDGARLGAIVDADLDGRLLDLVVDDCSHRYGPTRASFEALFPRLRPGGLYVIEDWNADHVFRDALKQALTDSSAPDHEATVRAFRESLASASRGESEAPRPPLSRLAVELLVARSSLTEAFAEVAVDEFWITVRRGEATLDPATFRLRDHYTDHFGFVPPIDGER